MFEKMFPSGVDPAEFFGRAQHGQTPRKFVAQVFDADALPDGMQHVAQRPSRRVVGFDSSARDGTHGQSRRNPFESFRPKNVVRTFVHRNTEVRRLSVGFRDPTRALFESAESLRVGNSFVRNEDRDQAVGVSGEIRAHQSTTTFLRPTSPDGQKTRQSTVGGTIRREEHATQPVLRRDFAADHEPDRKFLRGHVGPYDSGHRRRVGQGEGFIPQSMGRGDEFVGMRGSPQERKAGDAMQFDDGCRRVPFGGRNGNRPVQRMRMSLVEGKFGHGRTTTIS